MKNIKFIRGMLLTVLLAGLSVQIVSANQVSAVLNTNQTSSSTSDLGNTTGAYKMVGAISSTSKYNVEYYLYTGADSAHCTVVKAKFSWDKTSAFTKQYNVSKNNYTVAKVVMYGNQKSNPKKDCYANVILSNN